MEMKESDWLFFEQLCCCPSLFPLYKILTAIHMSQRLFLFLEEVSFVFRLHFDNET